MDREVGDPTVYADYYLCPYFVAALIRKPCPKFLLWLIPDAASLHGSDVINLYSALFPHYRNAILDLNVTLPYQQKTFSVRV